MSSAPEPPQPPPQRVDVHLPARTLGLIVAVGALVALAVLSLGTLLSILVAVVLALGVDPPVGGLERRGWRRGPAALAVSRGCSRSCWSSSCSPPARCGGRSWSSCARCRATGTS